MDWNEIADKPLRFEATAPNLFADPLLVTLPNGFYPLRDSTLRQLLTHNLDITAIPKPFFFQYISHFTSDPTHKERLQEFGDSAFRDEFYDYATRPRRSILEVLVDFPSVKLPYQDVGCAFPFIRGRQFSICSGGLGKQVGRPPTIPKTEPDHLVKVQLLVAIVKYKTVLRKIRQGLCSRYIASLKPDSLLNIKMESNHNFYKAAERSPHRPIIMVAAGTGVAPCRSLIWDRSSIVAMRDLQDDSPPVGENILIYGGRNKDKDFFFEDEWTSAPLRTQVFTAFSRDQREKIYVQDIIRRESKKLSDLIKDGAVIYVCGSSGNMPKAVREAFLEVIMMHGIDSRGATATREHVEKLLERLERLGYYVQETW
jgi:sulfite reductase alpha subunit-like flavoprotein